jgi:flagellar basal body-associated protein FliL
MSPATTTEAKEEAKPAPATGSKESTGGDQGTAEPSAKAPPEGGKDADAGKLEGGKDAPADPKAKAAKKAGAKLALPKLPPQVLLIGVIVMSLAAGIAVGAMVLGPPLVRWRKTARPAAHVALRAPSEAKGTEKGDAGKSVVFRIDNIVVNPAGSAGQRFVMAAVAFDLDDERALSILREHEMQVRDAVISTLEAQTLESLTRPGARDSLKDLLAGTVRPMLGRDRRVRVYLPQFVIQ